MLDFYMFFGCNGVSYLKTVENNIFYVLEFWISFINDLSENYDFWKQIFTRFVTQRIRNHKKLPAKPKNALKCKYLRDRWKNITPRPLGLFVKELQSKVDLAGYDILFASFAVEAKSKIYMQTHKMDKNGFCQCYLFFFFGNCPNLIKHSLCSNSHRGYSINNALGLE